VEGSNFDSLATGFGERAAVEFPNLSSIYVPWKQHMVEREIERVCGIFLSVGI